MKRHRSRRQNQTQKLNLVALMDIFTLLVFFLMVNSSDVQIKETHEAVILPKSLTTQLPDNTVKLYITQDYMFFDNSNQKIALTVDDQSSTYPQLVTALKTIAQSQGNLPKALLDKGRAITLLGDQQTHYSTIQKVLASCAQTEFRDVSLAVIYNDADNTASGLQATTASR